MDSELSGLLAKRLQDELNCYIETRVATSGENQLVVMTSKATCLVRQRGERLVISPMLLQLGRYVQDGDDYPKSVECVVSVNAFLAAVMPYIEALEYYTHSLRMRQVKVKENYESKQGIADAMFDVNTRLRVSNYGTDLFGQAKTWQVSAEVVSAERVSMYIDCAPDIAVAIAKAIAEMGK
jgi:hypothetical protein